MIEIKCTEEQKKLMINAINTKDACSLFGINDCAGGYCSNCIERNIKWNIQPEPLKPCPCCGGEAAYCEFDFNKSVSCTKCNLQTISYKTEKEAADAWNRRVNNADSV